MQASADVIKIFRRIKSFFQEIKRDRHDEKSEYEYGNWPDLSEKPRCARIRLQVIRREVADAGRKNIETEGG